MTINFMALVCERTIPTERQPLVSKISANCLQIQGGVASARRIPYGRKVLKNVYKELY
jgi:hypothetical protein